jgi:TRAP-type transport system periplasmic protein
MRPWLWPVSQVMKDLYMAIGANGVPLGLPEVYGALQTDMIDMVIATSLAVVALQWHAKLTHVTGNTFGVLLGSMIMNNDKWNAIPPDIQKHLLGEITKNTDGAKEDTRKSDDNALAKLKGRGYTVTKFDAAAEADYDVTAAAVRKKLAGRVYPAALLKRVEDIVATAK